MSEDPLNQNLTCQEFPACPLDEEVTLHPEGDTFPPDNTPVKMKKTVAKKHTASCSTYHKVQRSQELQEMKWQLEEKIAKEKEAIANYQAHLEINQLQQTLNQLQKEKQGMVQVAQLDLKNNGFWIDYINESILTKPKDVNLVQVMLVRTNAYLF